MALPVSLFLDTLPRVLAQPCLERGDERAAALMAHIHALLRRQPVDLALNRKQHVDARDRLLGDRRLVDAREIEKLASTMGPAGRLNN